MNRYKRMPARFWAHAISDKNGCLLWTAARNAGGYGIFGFNGSTQLAHRVAWQLINGPIPNGMYVCHRCDIRHCIEPSHLWLGTHTDNIRDMEAKGRGRHPFGVGHGSTKATPAQVLAVFRAKRGQVPKVAKAVGIRYSAAKKIRAGKIWAHLTRSLAEQEGSHG